MKSILRATICTAAMGLAVPAMAATDDAPMHHHHRMHGKHGMMKKGATSGDAETAKLNDQSLQNAKAGMTPASSAAPSTPGASSGAMSAPPGNAMAPASGSAPMTAPGTGMSAPSSGAMGTTAPNMPSAAPATTPATGTMTPPAPGNN